MQTTDRWGINPGSFYVVEVPGSLARLRRALVPIPDEPAVASHP